MSNFSQESQELLNFMRNDYIEQGYMYSGAWPYSSLKELGYGKEAIHELQASGKIQRRDCDDYAFELSAAERGTLITGHNLASVWYEKKGNALLSEIQQEVRHASEIPVDKETGKITVSTLKAVGDHNRPDKMTVACPFYVGQVVRLEYDLPKKLRKVGYGDFRDVTLGRQVGQFMVTNIVHNMLVDPQINMLEIQSMSDEFNKLHPRSRTMMVFEDIVLKRMRNKVSSLSEQIQSASNYAVEPQTSEKSSAKGSKPER